MSAPADVSSAASTPAPSTPSATPAESTSSTSSSSDGKGRWGIDPHTSWEEFRGQKTEDKAPAVDTPRLTPDKMKAWLDAQDADEDVEQGDAKAKTERATDDVQKLAAEATAKTTPDPEPPKGPREFKVKVKGEERAVPLDKFAALVKLPAETVEKLAAELGEPAVVQLYSRLHNGEESARERTELKREMDRLFAGLKSHPLDMLIHMSKRPDIGFDALDVAYQIVQRDIDDKAMTPEAKELRAVKEELAQRKRKDDADQRERERVLQEAHDTAERNRRQTFANNYDAQIMGALADAKLPADDYHFGLIHSRLLGDMQRDGDAYREPGTPAEMRARAAAHIPAVKEQIRQALKAVYADADPETVKAFIADHPELHAASAKERVAAYKKNSAAQAGGNGADNTRGEKPVPGAPKNQDAWLADLRRRA